MVDPKQTIEYLLGQIVTGQEAMAKDIAVIRANQKSIKEKVEAIEKKEAWLKGVIFAIGAIGGVVGGFVKSLLS